MDTGETKRLSRLGFRFGRSSVHTARTMMLAELRELLAYTGRSDAEKADYLQAIERENCLGKRSVKTRKLTYRHLAELYSLDRHTFLFRNLLYFWTRDPAGQALLALLCTYARDSLFRSTAPFVLSSRAGTVVTREALEKFLDDQEPGRFSPATLKSTAQNINATWTQSGHLRGRTQKIRAQAAATAGSVAYALLLGYVRGRRGPELLCTEYIRLLECSVEKTLELAEEASRKGWITLKTVGDVVEILFPNLISQEELEWIREQNYATDAVLH